MIDLVGGDVADRSWKVLRQGGTLLSSARFGNAAPRTDGRKGMAIVMQPDSDRLGTNAQTAASGQLKITAAETVPLAAVPDAIERNRTGHAPGHSAWSSGAKRCHRGWYCLCAGGFSAAPPSLVFASVADLSVYLQIPRCGLVLTVVASSLVGLVIDTLIFLQLAFGGTELMWDQVVGKGWMVLAAPPFIYWLRAHDERQQRELIGALGMTDISSKSPS